MSDKKIGWLGYNNKNDRIGILDKMDLWADNGLHRGESFELFLNGEWVADRLEFSNEQWYLVDSKLRGSQLEGLKVRY